MRIETCHFTPPPAIVNTLQTKLSEIRTGVGENARLAASFGGWQSGGTPQARGKERIEHCTPRDGDVHCSLQFAALLFRENRETT